MAFSPSKIKLYEQCARKYKFVYIDKLPEPANQYAARGTLLHAELEAVLKGGLMLLSNETQWLEKQIDYWVSNKAESEKLIAVNSNWEECELDDKDVMIRGVIDLFYRLDNKAVVRDFKTGKQRDYSDQVKLYAAVMLSILPDIESVDLHIDYIDLKKSEKYDSVPRSQLEELKAYFSDKISMIGSDKIFAPNPSYLCKWCHFRKDNGGSCQW